MRRRVFMTLLGGVAVALPFVVYSSLAGARRAAQPYSSSCATATMLSC